jgi:transcriptional regulator with XRE-family HTH domain
MKLDQNFAAKKLREIRKSKGWSLQDVEKASKGKWKAVVVGSYERSDRAISLKKTIELMAFYQVPISVLFDENLQSKVSINNQPTIIIDQRNLAMSTDIALDGVKRMISYLTARRRDWNGEVLSLRSSDIQFLAVLLNTSDEGAIDYLKNRGYVIN